MRALARVNLAAVERNCARLAAAAAPAARAGGAGWLAVATALEARGLRDAGLDGPLLVLGALAPPELDIALAARADVTIWREDHVAALAAHPGSAGTGVHVKLDSGMGRLGTPDPAEALRVADAAAAAPGLRLVGAM